MKKLFTSFLGILALSLIGLTNATADEELCGTIDDIESIQLWESSGSDVPVDLTMLMTTFTSVNQNEYALPAAAYGTQLSLALLKAYNNPDVDLPLDACLRIIFDPFSVQISWIEFSPSLL